MGSENNSQISHFILLGISKNPSLQPFFFVLFLAMYLVTMLGNLLMVLATIMSRHLHTPMYFFLSNLSVVDACFTSTTVPKMLVNINTKTNSITYKNCIAQMHFFILFSGLEIFLLTLMAYDRYVAICLPLHYTTIMSPQLCFLMVIASWIMNVIHSITQSLMTLRLTFCTHLEIPHFFCELNQVVQNACSDTLPNHVVIYFAAVLWACCPLIGILYSYSKIFSSLRAISSLQGKYKAFSTCTSHLIVVSLFYGTGLGVYLSSASTKNSQSTARASVMYSVVTPMLNPFIYSLRNKDIKKALRKILC